MGTFTKLAIGVASVSAVSIFCISTCGKTTEEHVLDINAAIEQCAAKHPDQKLLATTVHNKFVEIEQNNPVATCVANTVHNNADEWKADAEATRMAHTRKNHRGNVTVSYNVLTNEYFCARYEGFWKDDSNLKCYNSRGTNFTGISFSQQVVPDSDLMAHRRLFVKETYAKTGGGHYLMKKAMIKYDHLSQAPSIKNPRERTGFLRWESRYSDTGSELNSETGQWSCTVKSHDTREWTHLPCPNVPWFANGKGPA